MLRLCRHGGKLVPVWSPAPLPTSFSLCVGAAHPHHTHSSLTPLCKEGKLRHGTGNPMLCWGCCALCNIPNSGRPSSSPRGLSGLGGAVRDTKQPVALTESQEPLITYSNSVHHCFALRNTCAAPRAVGCQHIPSHPPPPAPSARTGPCKWWSPRALPGTAVPRAARKHGLC